MKKSKYLEALAQSGVEPGDLDEVVKVGERAGLKFDPSYIPVPALTVREWSDGCTVNAEIASSVHLTRLEADEIVRRVRAVEVAINYLAGMGLPRRVPGMPEDHRIALLSILEGA